MKTDRKVKADSNAESIKTVKKVRSSTAKSRSKANGKHLPWPYEHAPVGIVESSLDCRYLNVNKEFCRILGYEKEELLKGEIKVFTHEEDYPADMALYEQLARGEIPFYRLEKRFVHKNGEVVWTDMTRSAVRDAKGKILYVVSTIVDISERKKADAQIKWQAHLLAELADAVIATDANFVLTSWNKAAEQIYGWKAEEVIGKNAQGILQTEFIADTRQTAREQTRTAGSFSGEVMQMRKDGTRIIIEGKVIAIRGEEGTVQGYVSVNRDITERKRAENALRESQQRFSATYEYAPIGIVECSLEGKYLNVNEEFCRILGYPKDELIGHGFKGITHEDDYAIDIRLHQKLVSGEIPFYRLEKRYLRKDGRIIWTEITRLLVRDPAGNPLYSIGTIIDISERKQVESVLRESAERLRLATEAARMFTWEWDFRKRSYTLADNFEQVVGFSAGLLPKDTLEPLLKLSHVDDVEVLAEEVRQALQHHNDPHAIQYRMIDPVSGETTWLEVSAKIVYNEDGNAERMFGVAQNINEAKQAQEELMVASSMPEQNPNPALRLTPAGKVLYANRASQHLFKGSNRQDHPSIPHELHRQAQEAFASNARRELEIEQNGKTFSFTLAPIPAAGYINLYGKDVTERRKAEQALSEYAREQEALYQLADQLHRTNSLEDVFNAALDAILNALQCDRASILLYDASNIMRFVAWRGLSGEYRQATGGHSPWTPDEKNPVPICMNDMDTADLSDSLKATITAEGIGSLAFIPLVINGKLIGKFMAYFNTPHVFSDEEVNLCLTIAHQLAFGVDRKRAEEKLRVSEDRLRLAVAAGNIGIWDIDLQQRDRTWTKEGKAIYGLAEDEFLDYERQLVLTHPEDRARVDELVRAFRDAGSIKQLNMEHRIIRPDGSLRWVEVHGEAIYNGEPLPVRLIGTIVDITERKHIEEQLRAKESELEDIINQTPFMLTRCTRDLRYRFVSRAYAEMIGRTPEEVQGKMIAEIMGEAGLKTISPYIEQVLQGTPVEYENEVSFRDVGAPFLHVVYTPDRDEQGNVIGWFASIVDISARKLAEEALRIENERFMRFMNSNIVGILIASASGKVTLANDYYLNLLGVKRQDMTEGKVDWRKFTPPEWLPADEKAIQEMRESGVCEPYEKEYIRADGRRVPVYIADAMLPGPAEEIAAFVVDMTDRKRAEEALRESEARYRGIFNQTIGGIAESDLTGKFTMVNDRYCELTGYSREKLLNGMGLQDLTHPDDLPKNLELFGRLVADGTSFEIEKRYVRADGSIVWVHNSVSAITDAAGKPQSAVAVVIDVTERKQAEEHLRQSAELDAFRLTLTDALRALNDPEMILSEAMRVLGEKLQVDRVLYSEIDNDDETILIVDNYAKEGVPKLSGRASLNDYGKSRGSLSAGQNLVIADSVTSSAMDEKDRASFAALGIRSGLGVPLIKGGRWVATLGVHHSAPRMWTENEIKFVEETAERTWSALEHARAQEKLRASESLYRTIARSVPGGGVYVVDKDFRYVVAEGPVTEAFGLTRDVLEGHTVTEAFSDERGARMEERLKKTFAGETISFETRFNGRVYWTQQAPLLDSIGQAIIVTIDITERKQMEEALRESEERFRALLSQATAGIVRKDAEGRFTYVNQAFCNMLGYTDSELLGKTVWELMHPDDVAENKRSFDRLMVEGVPFKLERRFLRADNSAIWVDASVSPIMDATGKPQSAVAVEVDITGRKQAEEALQQLNLQLENRVQQRTVKLNNAIQSLRDEIAERRKVELALRRSEATSRLLFNTAPDTIVITDEAGTIVHVNARITNLFGYDPDEILGKPVESLIPERFHGRHKEHRRTYNEQRVKRAMGLGMDLFGQRKNGSEFPIDVMLTPIANIPGWDIMVTIRDITERKAMESALYKSHERLRVLSQRLVEVQEEERRAIARELHDRVGQTLAALNINLIIINSQLTSDVAQQIGTRLSDSMKLVAETIALVRDVMTDLRPAVLDDYGLEAALEAHLSQFMARYDINAQLEKASLPIPRLGPSIEMTFMRIAQEALMNIARHARATQVDLSLRQEEDAITMTIHDNGIGIESWQDANRPGSHGLTIMRERAEAFGGTFKVKSIPGQGTTIEASIPYKNQEQHEAQEESE